MISSAYDLETFEAESLYICVGDDHVARDLSDFVEKREVIHVVRAGVVDVFKGLDFSTIQIGVKGIKVVYLQVAIEVHAILEHAAPTLIVMFVRAVAARRSRANLLYIGIN